MIKSCERRPANLMIGFICTIVTLVASPLFAEIVDSSATPPPLWRQEIGLEIKTVLSSDGPTVLIATLDSLYGLDKLSGEFIWRIGRKATTYRDISLIDNTDLALVVDKRLLPLREDRTYSSTFDHGLRLTAMDVTSGQTAWDTDSLGELASQGCFIVPEKDLCLIFVNDGEESPWLKAIDLHTGKLLWNQERFFASTKPHFCKAKEGIKTLQRNPEPILDTDSTIITFFSKNCIHKWDIRTGELIWKCKVDDKQDPSQDAPCPAMALSRDRQTIYVPCEKRLWAVRAADGTSVWKEPQKFRGVVTQIQDVPEGILLRYERWGAGTAQGPGILLLNPETGQRAWKRSYTKLNEYTTSDFVVRDSAAYIWSENRIYRIALADGSYVEITDEANVEGIEAIPLITALENGLFLASNQTVMLISYQGEMMYHTYHRQPGLSDMEKLFITAVSLAAGALTNNLMGVPWHRNMALGIRMSALAQERPDYRHSDLEREYVYMVAKKAGPPQETVSTGYPGNRGIKKIGPKQKPGIVKVDLSTGETVNQLVLDDELPMYDVDPENGLLFYVMRNEDDKDRDRRIVAAYSF